MFKIMKAACCKGLQGNFGLQVLRKVEMTIVFLGATLQQRANSKTYVYALASGRATPGSANAPAFCPPVRVGMPNLCILSETAGKRAKPSMSLARKEF